MSVDFPIIGGGTSGQLSPTTRQPDTDNYLKTNNYKFSITRCPTIEYFTQSINLPGISVGMTEFPTKYATPVKLPNNLADHGELSIRMIVDEKLRNFFEMYNWIKETVPLREIGNDPNEYFSTANLLVLNSGFTPVLDVEFINVYPTRLGDIPFTSSQTMSEPAVIDVSLSYSGYIVKDLT
jgi:hypothetical protein|tara:strand:+ start:2835 stop:3377 length:543 start_codon:yes stop_codon:yes gene_type:complete